MTDVSEYVLPLVSKEDDDMNKRIDVDCLIIGAGPAGSLAAEVIARNGHSAMMIEKRPEIGLPIRCGEGISSSVLELLALPDKGRHISTRIDGARIISPSGHIMNIKADPSKHHTGFILNRDIFDRMLASRAYGSGCDVRVLFEAVGMVRENGRAKVRCMHLGDRYDIEARIVIAADGFESKVARWGGLNPSLSPRDVDTCLQYRMVDIDHDRSFCDFYIGRRYAPGGYVWCFPKGEGTFNVGIGVNESMLDGPASPRRYLDSFISRQEEFKRGKIVEIHAGGVSVGLPMECTVADNLIVVGDAARMIDPLTGGGINNACVSALHAGRVASECIESSSFTAGDLEAYESSWRKDIEDGMVIEYLAKERFLDMEDELLDSIISVISSYDLEEISTNALLNLIKAKFPELLNI